MWASVGCTKADTIPPYYARDSWWRVATKDAIYKDMQRFAQENSPACGFGEWPHAACQVEWEVWQGAGREGAMVRGAGELNARSVNSASLTWPNSAPWREDTTMISYSAIQLW
jgi:hypothetical protein